jgi:hypothetical protein
MQIYRGLKSSYPLVFSPLLAYLCSMGLDSSSSLEFPLIYFTFLPLPRPCSTDLVVGVD